VENRQRPPNDPFARGTFLTSDDRWRHFVRYRVNGFDLLANRDPATGELGPWYQMPLLRAAVYFGCPPRVSGL
jgi:hypothetical protein